MQFMPATWVAYGVDGNHDGFADPSIPPSHPSTAGCSAPTVRATPRRLMDAVELYNPGDPTYAVAVMEVAKAQQRSPRGVTATGPPRQRHRRSSLKRILASHVAVFATPCTKKDAYPPIVEPDDAGYVRPPPRPTACGGGV